MESKTMKRKLFLSVMAVVTSVSVFCACGASSVAPAEESQETVVSSVETELSEEQAAKLAGNKTSEGKEGASTEEGTGFSYDAIDFEFESEDIYGTPIDQSIFSDYDLTLVNVFATWCPPCVAEMPDLAALYQEMEPQGVNFVGFVTDTRIDPASLDETAIETAKSLRDESGVEYAYIIPDPTFAMGLLFTEYVPTTYFVDRNGKIVGEPVVGSNDYEGWKQTIEERLSNL